MATTQKTKARTVKRLLKRKREASMDDIISATSWKPHSARAFLSRLRQRGYVVSRAEDRFQLSRYTITAEPDA